LRELLCAPVDERPIGSLDDWWIRFQHVGERYERTADRALVAGFRADRLGYAFAGGYQCAGAAAFCAAEHGAPLAFCATEASGVHPRAIESRLQRDGAGWRLDGSKTFVTLGAFAERLVVIASEGTRDDGTNKLRAACFDARRAGVELDVAPAAPFVPEIPHARVRFRGVLLRDDELLVGDGYADFLKPFRTIEDAHVHAALLGQLMRLARLAGAEPKQLQRLAAMASTIRALCAAHPSAPETHVALAGAMAQVGEVVDSIDEWWLRLDPLLRERWQRDRPLLQVASKARRLRIEAAWRRLTG
jgi:hypothetical protein